MRALITGASGYIGGCLAARLAADGASVHALLRSGSTGGGLDGLGDQVVRHVFDDDVSGNTPGADSGNGPGAASGDGGLTAILDTVRPDVVFHLASLFRAEHQPHEVEPLVRSNVLFGARLLEAMAATGAARLVNTGTAWQHFNDAGYDPVCLYAATKQAFEAILEFYVNARRLRAITLALFDTYGPADPRPKLFSLLRQAAGRTEPLGMSPGEQLIDLVHVDDVVDAFLLAADRLMRTDAAPGHDVYAVSSGAPLRLRDLVGIYESATGRSIPIEWGGRPYRGREVMTPWRTGRRLPGWAPRVELHAGLAAMESGIATVEPDNV